MRFSTSYVSFALVLVTSVAAVPLPFEDGLDNGLAARQEDFQFVESRGLFDKKGKGKDTDEVTDKSRKDGKPPKYKEAEKKQPPKYDPAGHPQLEFHSEHDPSSGSRRKDGTHVPREFIEAFLESRGLFDKKGKGKDTGEVTDKSRKDGKPPKYKEAEKKQPPKYDPAGHPQLEFHSEHDPSSGSRRKDGTHVPRDFIEEFLESRGLFDKKGKGKDTGEVTDKSRKDGKPPKYKEAEKKQPPKYDPAGHPQLEFHSEHDPSSGSRRKDGTHVPRDFIEEFLESRGLFDKKGKGKDTGEVTDKSRKDGKPPKYKEAEKKQPPKYDPAGHPQLEFHSEHDPSSGSRRKDGTHVPRNFIEEYFNARGLYMDEDLD